MDVKISNILTRFAFTIPSLYDDDDGYDAVVSSDDEDTRDFAHVKATDRHAAGMRDAVTRADWKHHSSRFISSESPSDASHITGAYAFVSNCGASSVPLPIPSSGPARNSSSSKLFTVKTQHGVDSRGGGSVRRGASLHLPDLLQLAARSWNVELHRGPTGVASHCVLRPPPYVVGTTLYRGPVVYVLASGVVRMATYGSVAATNALARRVRDALHEACAPLAMRRAAREEFLLLRAVLDEPLSGVAKSKDHSEGGAQTPCSAVLQAETQRPNNTMSFGTGFPGDGRAGRGLPTVPPALCEKACTIDFLQAVATPRWDEIAGLRASLFATASACLGGEGGVGVDEDGRVAKGIPRRVPVRCASVNVRGDAPMEWWKWYLNVQADDLSPSELLKSAAAVNRYETLHGDFATLHSRNDSLQPAGRSNGVAEEGDTSARYQEKTKGFWTCAGHTDASPATAANFVRFLRRRRALLAHHVVSFKLRRQATQSSLQILLDWRTTPPQRITSSPMSAAAAAAPIPAPVPAPSAAPLAGCSPLARPLISAPPVGVAQAPPDPSAPPASADPPNVHTSSRGWVTEASAAHFFMESTFIPESTAPCGMESVRLPMGGHGVPAEPAAFAHGELRDERVGNAVVETAIPLDCGGHDRMSVLFGNDKGHAVLCNDSALGGDGSAIKAAPAKRMRGGIASGTSPAKGDKHATAVEHVTCIMHCTGRVQITAASELAVEQMCAVLLIPFLVATAEIDEREGVMREA
ncbi:hypothetical protein JKF63_07157 [Porcisia hertigi]|uniref:Uncharacterized protein n=1 Tax=Porcisia hertigi TaxID=2761500 RepID=A0A837A9Y5_9TRYP|nr:hypothetical protein JKF63_07157 [Porcisia hertigi]